MGLQQRRKRFRWGISEGVFLFLIGSTVALFLFWGSLSPAPGWDIAPVGVAAISLLEEEGEERVEVLFSYAVQGKRYYGLSRPGLLQRTVFVALPENLRSLLESRGFIAFSDLPAPVRHMLESHGVLGFEHVPRDLVDDLRARGYASEQDLPENTRQALLSGDPERIAAALGVLLPAVPEEMSLNQGAGRHASLHESGILPRMDLLRVRFNKESPGEYQLAYFPGLAQLLRTAFILVFAAFTLVYGVFIYPRWKRLRAA